MYESVEDKVVDIVQTNIFAQPHPIMVTASTRLTVTFLINKPHSKAFICAYLFSMDALELQDIRDLSPDVLPHVYSTTIPEDRCSVSGAFWDEYSEKQRAIGYVHIIYLF